MEEHGSYSPEDTMASNDVYLCPNSPLPSTPNRPPRNFVPKPPALSTVPNNYEKLGTTPLPTIQTVDEQDGYLCPDSFRPKPTKAVTLPKPPPHTANMHCGQNTEKETEESVYDEIDYAEMDSPTRPAIPDISALPPPPSDFTKDPKGKPEKSRLSSRTRKVLIVLTIVVLALVSVTVAALVLVTSHGQSLSTPSATNTTSTTTLATNTTTQPMSDCITCYSLWQLGHREDRVYKLYLQSGSDLYLTNAYCDMTGGGYTVFMRRVNGSLAFNQTWDAYRVGFQDEEGEEFWLGNDDLYQLTSNCGPQALKVDLESCHGRKAHETYSHFQVRDMASNYTVSISGNIPGNARDALSSYIDGRMFSTGDIQDSCSKTHGGGTELLRGWWWKKSCSGPMTQLTGQYKPKCPGNDGQGIYWQGWPNPTQSTSLSGVRMSLIPTAAL